MIKGWLPSIQLSNDFKKRFLTIIYTTTIKLLAALYHVQRLSTFGYGRIIC